jgi:hypothetical protein
MTGSKLPLELVRQLDKRAEEIAALKEELAKAQESHRETFRLAVFHQDRADAALLVVERAALALQVLATMCRVAGLSAGEAKALEMLEDARAVLAQTEEGKP